MPTFAIIPAGKPVWSVEEHEKAPPTHPGLAVVECTGIAAAVPGATYANGVFTAPVVDQGAQLAARAAGMRAVRDQRLTLCDWTQIADAPIADAAKASWAAYRKGLRELPAQAGFPDAITWPVAP